MSAHTPGPWGNYEEGDYWGVETPSVSIVVWGNAEDGDDGGVRGKTIEEARANARLIAAAPDLLEALKAFVKAGDGHDDFTELWPVAAAAIAKAEGRS